VERLSVFLGANGAGKTNLYRALELVQGAAAGTLAADLAAEGGLASAFWAGARKRHEEARIALAVDLGETPGDAPGMAAFGYSVEVGYPYPTAAAFAAEPQVKEEALVHRHGRREIKLLDRRGPSLIARDEAGARTEIDADLMASETALSRLEDPSRFPDLQTVKAALLDWRFYHDLRTDAASPLRKPCPAVASPTLASDGANLAAVFATLAHIRQDTRDLDQTVQDAFPGARLDIPEPGRIASFGLAMPDYPQRVFEAHELSDGTLRFLGLAGALLAYRLPGFIALNEPESSLHPDMLAPLGRLIARAAERTQVWVVTHSERLAAAIAEHGAITPRTVVKAEGATTVRGLKAWGAFAEDAEDEA
jgi:predicted ATPase